MGIAAYLSKTNKVLLGIFLVQSALVACTSEEQNQATHFYQQAFSTDSYDRQIEFLDKSLKSCYSAVVAADKYLWKGDYSYDNGNYNEAKRFYSKIMQEVDKIENPKDKKKYQLLYYKSMQEVYGKLGERSLENIMKQKYSLVNKKGKSQIVHKSYVDAEDIYHQLSPSSQEKAFALKGMGVVEREISLSINFDHDSSHLSHKGKKQAEALGTASRKILQENTNGKIEIVGYTDTDGSANYNLNLSEKRAEAIKLFLLDNYGVKYSQLSYSGRGEESPVCPEKDGYNEFKGEYSCKGKEDKEASRRVEVRFRL